MISLAELNQHGYETNAEIDANLAILLVRINLIRAAYNVPMIVTSGLRSVAKQQELIDAGISKATHSKHMIGAAVDILDQDGSLHNWCKANEAVLVSAQLWMEERQGPWQHFQIIAPHSGHRWFLP